MANRRFIVVGLGKFGSRVALGLSELGHDVLAIDQDRERVERLAEFVDRALVVDAIEPGALEEAGGREADAGVVTVGRDVTTSVLVALALEDLGVGELYVKVVSDLHERILRKVGIEETIFPEREAAQWLAQRAASRSVLNFVELGPGLFAEEIVVPRSWIGRSLRDLELPSRFGVSVIAVREHLSPKVHPVPDPDAPLKDSDSLLLAGTEEALAALTD